MKKNRDSFSRIAYNYFSKKWFLLSFVAVAPLIIELITSFFMNDKNEKIILGIDIFFIIIVLVASIVRNLAINYDERKKIGTTNYYNAMVDVMNQNKTEQMEILLEIIDKEEYLNEAKKYFTPYNNSSSRLNPIKQIKNYCDNTRKILSETFDIDVNDIIISIFFRNVIDNHNCTEWDVLYSTYNLNDVYSYNIPKVNNSSFNQVQDSPGKIFFENKKKAYIDFKYIQSEEEAHKGFDDLSGTIYCHNISIMLNGKMILPVVICISSINQDLCYEDDVLAKNRALKLFKIIEVNIQYEITRMIFYKHTGLSKTLGGLKKKRDKNQKGKKE